MLEQQCLANHKSSLHTVDALKKRAANVTRPCPKQPVKKFARRRQEGGFSTNRAACSEPSNFFPQLGLKFIPCPTNLARLEASGANLRFRQSELQNKFRAPRKPRSPALAELNYSLTWFSHPSRLARMEILLATMGTIPEGNQPKRPAASGILKTSSGNAKHI